MLRLLNNKLATDDSLSRFVVQGPFKCFCCHNGMNEDINHLFSYGQIAEKVWKFFEHTLELLWPNSDSIRTNLMRWWSINIPTKCLNWPLNAFLLWFSGNYGNIDALINRKAPKSVVEVFWGIIRVIWSWLSQHILVTLLTTWTRHVLSILDWNGVLITVSMFIQ